MTYLLFEAYSMGLLLVCLLILLEPLPPGHCRDWLWHPDVTLIGKLTTVESFEKSFERIQGWALTKHIQRPQFKPYNDTGKDKQSYTGKMCCCVQDRVVFIEGAMKFFKINQTFWWCSWRFSLDAATCKEFSKAGGAGGAHGLHHCFTKRKQTFKPHIFKLYCTQVSGYAPHDYFFAHHNYRIC